MKTFEQIHEEGSQRYGLWWLKANQIATQVATYYGMDVTKEPVKTALSAVCLGFLNRIASPIAVGIYEEADEVLRKLPLGIFSLQKFGIDEITAHIKQWRDYLSEFKAKWVSAFGNERAPKKDGQK